MCETAESEERPVEVSAQKSRRAKPGEGSSGRTEKGKEEVEAVALILFLSPVLSLEHTKGEGGGEEEGDVEDEDDIVEGHWTSKSMSSLSPESSPHPFTIRCPTRLVLCVRHPLTPHTTLPMHSHPTQMAPDPVHMWVMCHEVIAFPELTECPQSPAGEGPFIPLPLHNPQRRHGSPWQAAPPTQCACRQSVHPTCRAMWSPCSSGTMWTRACRCLW